MKRKHPKLWPAALSLTLVAGSFAGVLPAGAALASPAPPAGIIVDGSKDGAWDGVPSIAKSPTDGFNGGGSNVFNIGDIKLSNDGEYLYFWVDALKVPNWGGNGTFLDLALNINNADSEASASPWSEVFNFSGTAAAPQYHVVMRVSNDQEVNFAALYNSSDPMNALLDSGNLSGAQFAVDRTKGFEGRIPLSKLGLKHGDAVRALGVLSGNGADHGAFDVSPSDAGNQVAASWNTTKAAPNVESAYSAPYYVHTNYSPTVDGTKDADWSSIPDLGTSPTKGWQDFRIDHLKLTNDGTNLYFWVDAVNVPNWGDEGQYLDLALKVNESAAGSSTANPWGSQYNYTGTDVAPSYHVVMRVKKDQEVAGAAVYQADEPDAPLHATWDAALDKGAKFAVDRTKGFEGSVPLKLLNLANGDALQAIAVLGGNNGGEHGAFDVIPEDAGNQTAKTWNESANPNVQSTYTGTYTVAGIPIFSSVAVTATTPAQNATGAALQAPVKIAFSESVNLTDAAKVTLKDADGNDVAADVSVADNQLTVQPQAALSYATVYTLALEAGAVTGTVTGTVNDTLSLSFTTKDFPKVIAAIADAANTVKLKLSETAEGLDYSKFALYENGTKLAGTSVKGADDVSVTIQASPGITDPTHDYTVRYDGGITGLYAEKGVTLRNVLNQYVYNGNDLGVTYGASSSTFKIWAPTAKTLALNLYNDAADTAPAQTVAMTRDPATGVWTGTATGDLANKYYMYDIAFPDGTQTLAQDPYARATSVNSTKSAVVNLSLTNPANWNPDAKPPMVGPTDAIIYELHTRDFSMDPNSGVSEQNRGKFTAFTESGTHLPGDDTVSTGLDHLKELGITHVHLLPFYDFGSVDEAKVDDPAYTGRKFNWGYDPVNYNVPEGSYATDSAQENPTKRITEMKAMIQALHDKGIRIVLDVVYNHTFVTGTTDSLSVFDKVVPGYYYRTDDFGVLTNGSGVNNEVASERPMVRKYIKDSVKYLAQEYNADGFRFDLFGLIDTPTMKQITQELQGTVDPTQLIYGEPWTGGSSSLPAELQTLKGSQKDGNFAVFNDNIRGAIKGDNDGDGPGFATGAAGREADIVKGVMGSISDFTNRPSESINYVTVHDNLNLWDKVLKTQHIDASTDPFATLTEANVMENETVRRSLLANGIVFTSQGIPLFHAGDELLRSKFGDHNSYKSPDSINMIRWSQKKDYKPVFDYYKGMIELRKEHPAFRMDTKTAVLQNLQVLKSNGNVVAFQLKNNANGDRWKNIVVIYNANETMQSVTLPAVSSKWNVVLDDTDAGTETIREINGSIAEVAPLSMMVLYDVANTAQSVVTSIDLGRSFLGLNPGDSKLLNAIVKDQLGSPMLGEMIHWSSSNPAAAAVSPQGKITAVAAGEAVITAQVGAVMATLTVHVAQLVPQAITLNGAKSVYAKSAFQLEATVLDQFGQEMHNASVEWTSSDTSIASVDPYGKVSGVAEGTAVITAKAGSVSTQWTVTVKPYVKRYVQFNYLRDGIKAEDGWNLWVWNTGAKNDQIDFTTYTDGMASVNIEVAPGVTNFGFIVRKGTDWATAKQDIQNDRAIVFNMDDTFTKAYVTANVQEYRVVPSVTGPELKDGSITFVYRDDVLFQANRMTDLSGVKVKINGQAYPMVYDASTERFSYTLANAQEGTYTYTFLATQGGQTTEVNDPKNTVNGVSKVVYHRPTLQLNATVSPAVVTDKMNTVLKVDVQSNQSVTIKDIYVDLTPIGGPARVSIDPELKAQTIAVKQGTVTGAKTLDVTVIDEFGNKSYTTATLTVQPALSTGGALDFDWDEARIYFMLTDRFSNGDVQNDANVDPSLINAYHGGDFRGVINKLDYLKDLGINTVWITPIVDNIDFNVGQDNGTTFYGYHGYWAKDFTKLDEHLGDMDTFKELIDKAHEKGIKIMVDVVLNHTGYGLKPTDPLRDGVTQEDQDRFAGMLRTDGVSSNTDPVKGELANLPDLKTEDPAVRAKIIEWQTDWLSRAKTDKGNTIDYFRVDTIKHVESTTWKAFKNALTEVNPEFRLIGEYFGGSVDNNGGFLRSGQMDSLLDFDFKNKAADFVNGGRIVATEQALEDRESKLDNTSTMGQFLSSHDEDGFLSMRIGGDEGKLKAAAALQITSKGQPVIYYGEELGLSGANAGEQNRKDMPWDQLQAKQDLHQHYQKLLQIRAKHSKLMSKGVRASLAASDQEGTLVFSRTYEGQSLVVGLNVSTVEKTVKTAVPFAAGTVLMDEYNTGMEYTVGVDQTVELAIPSRDNGGTAILAVKPGQALMTSIELDTVSPMLVGTSWPSVVLAVYSDGSKAPLTSGVTYASSNPQVASVDPNGVVAALSVGSTVITATYGTFSDAETVSVEALPVVVPTLASLSLVGPSALTVGTTGQTVVTAVYSDASTRVIVQGVTYASSVPGVAVITDSGLIQALRAGTTVLTAVYGGKTAELRLTVSAPAVVTSPSAPVVPKTASEKVADQLKSGNTTVEMKDPAKGVELPANVSELLKDQPAVTLKNDQVTVVIPKETLAELLEQLPAELRKDSTIVFKAEPVAKDQLAEKLKAASAEAGAAVQPAGDVFEFTLAVKAKDGKVEKLTKFEQPITLTFKVNPAADAKLLGVYYIADNGTLEYVGGKLENGVFKADVYHFSKYAVLEFSKTYSDVAAGHWAADVIKVLSAKHVVDGVTNDRFAPESTVTRAQFAAMLVRALDLTGSSKASAFTDVAADAWYASAVAAAAEAGLVTGRDAVTFAPDALISREEMAVMIVRAYELRTGKKLAAADASAFADAAAVSSWAQRYVSQAAAAGLLQGRDGGRFEPQGVATRAESAQVIYNLLQP